MEPLVPADVDLRDFGFMPLDVRRLLTSETWIEAADEPKVGHAAMCLWAESWHQVPAASLPDNDRVLARLAMCDAREWKSLKDKIMAGWVKCSDGLLYHPVVAEKALDSWKAKCARRARTRAATEAREARKRDENPDRHVQPDVERNEQRDVERNEDRNVHQGTGTGTGTGIGIEDQEPASPSSTAAPSTDLLGQQGNQPADLKTHRAQRLAQITDEAIETFNASRLVKPNGGMLATVSAKVGREKRQQQVARFLRTARAICVEDYDSQTITREFLEDYWAACLRDDHKSGRSGGGKDHANWVPTFEYLTREKTMLEVYDRVNSEDAA